MILYTHKDICPLLERPRKMHVVDPMLNCVLMCSNTWSFCEGSISCVGVLQLQT